MSHHREIGGRSTFRFSSLDYHLARDRNELQKADRPLCNAQQFDLENKRGTTPNARLGELPIAPFGRDVDFPFVADDHLLQGDNPSFYETGEPESRRDTPQAAVEFLAIDRSTGVVNGDDTIPSRMAAGGFA